MVKHDDTHNKRRCCKKRCKTSKTKKSELSHKVNLPTTPILPLPLAIKKNSDIYTEQYNNGLKMIYCNNLNSNITSVVFYVKVGSINEPEGLYGYSHFLEHITFKGTRNYENEIEVIQEMDNIGAHFNATTTMEYTSFEFKCNSDNLDKLLLVFNDIILHAILDENESNKEKTVVIDEINMYKDNMSRICIERLNKIMYKGTSYQRTVGSEPKYIEKFDHEKGKRYYNKYYNPGNIVISICSSFSFDEIKSKLASIDLTHGNSNTYTEDGNTEYKITDSNVRKWEFISKDGSQITLGIAFKICDKHSKDRHALFVLSVILGGNMTSILVKKLRVDNGISYNIDVGVDFYNPFGGFYICTQITPDKFTQGLSLIIENLNSIKSGSITEDNLISAKKYIEGTLSLSQENTLKIAEQNGYDMLFNIHPISIQDTYSTYYENISLSDINSVINKYFSVDNLHTCYAGNNIENNHKLIREIRIIEGRFK
tara:strand:- start:24 stop:1475 length:1452 start_codon:yes stop_codon:yes gene_type:complete